MKLRSLIDRGTERLVRNLPELVAGRLDVRRQRVLEQWNVPLNGQLGRQALVRDLLARVAFKTIIETGTFRGATTTFFASSSAADVKTVELSKRYGYFAQAVLKPLSNVELKLGDSRQYLRELANRDTELTQQPTFFYLDAHWNADVPRSEEVEYILETWPSAVIMIDDFKVSGDPGYGYATYGGRELDVSYLPNLGDAELFFPAMPATSETGARRGCVVIATQDLASLVRASNHLRTTA